MPSWIRPVQEYVQKLKGMNTELVLHTTHGLGQLELNYY
jgi:hypothetical protein